MRVGLRVSPKVPVQIEAMVGGGGSRGSGTNTATLVGGLGASRPFQILYRNEEVTLRDIIQFRAHLLGNNIKFM